MNMSKMITFAAVATSAAIPMAVNADIVTNEVDGVKWALNIDTSAKTACLGAYTAGGNGGSGNNYAPHRTIEINAYTGRLVIPEFFMIDDAKYTVNKVGNRAFYGCKMTSVVIPAGVTTITYYGFQQANSLRDICIKGPLSAADGGAQTVRTISFTETPFGGSGIKFVLVGPNLKLGGTASKFQVGSSGAQFLLPKKSGNTTWTNNTLPTDKHTITYYGPDEEFDMEMGETTMTFYPNTTEALANILSLAPRFKSSFDLDTKIVVTNRIKASESVSITDSMLQNVTVDAPLRFLAFTPTTANALTNVLSWAPSFMTHFGLDTRISVTNTIDLTDVTITPAMVAGVTFDRLMFSAKTQAQLDAILGAFPATTPISIDPTGLTENMVIPSDYLNVYVKTVPGVTIKRSASGFMIIVR